MARVRIPPAVSQAIGRLAGRTTMVRLLLQLRAELEGEESATAHRRNRDPEEPDARFRVPLAVFSRGRIMTFVFAVSDPSPDDLIVEAVMRVPPPLPGEERG